MRLQKTEAENYWEDHGGPEWKKKVGKRVDQPHYVNQLKLVYKAFDKTEFKNKRVLEVGCGFGRILNHLEDSLSILADGMDQSSSMLEEAKRGGIDEKRLIHANMREIPRRIKRYDVIYTCEALIHIHPYHLLGVLSTILKKSDGTVIHIETSPTDKFYADECHAGFYKHDYLYAYKLLGKEVKIISQEGTQHSAYIINVK